MTIKSDIWAWICSDHCTINSSILTTNRSNVTFFHYQQITAPQIANLQQCTTIFILTNKGEHRLSPRIISKLPSILPMFLPSALHLKRTQTIPRRNESRQLETERKGEY